MDKWLKRAGLVAVFAGVLLAPAAVRAGILLNDGNAIAAFNGSAALDDGMSFFPPPTGANATLDYAVYEPGMFDLSFAGQDPSGGTAYVYAYQLHNVEADITLLSVGLNGDEPVDLNSIGSFSTDAAEATPSNALFATNLTSAKWEFTVGALTAGTSSEILLFASNSAPEWESTSISTSSGAPAGTSAPSPDPEYVEVPEPATMALLGIGGLGLIARRRTRH